MRYVVSKKFKRSFDRLSKATKRQFIERRKLFEAEPYHPLLHNHALAGAHSDCRSLNVNGDVRVIFAYCDPDTVHLIDIGTHSQLYG
jgi:addiction module RelE/StbE family toxin